MLRVSPGQALLPLDLGASFKFIYIVGRIQLLWFGVPVVPSVSAYPGLSAALGARGRGSFSGPQARLRCRGRGLLPTCH